MWFLSKKGKALLQIEDMKTGLKTPEIKEHELAEENFGEDVEFEKNTKPKSILDFLRTDYGESKTSTEEGS
jgi:hypothetical protein